MLLGRIVLHRINLFLVAVLTLLVSGNFMVANAKTGPEIRLVLQVTVDGLRGDLLNRYQAGFGKDGFRYLMKQGTVYTNAHYQHANTETIVGHATLATGTFPSQHCMVGNGW
jgi:predicted AlkP superfamily pyrophosphatase or phosphodiesterase